MIATNNEAVDVLRHGWQDAASSLAADVPEVADLLRARVERAIATQRLDERNLLKAVEEVESIISRAGSSSGNALSRRLRRTVYEYLLALDAVRPVEAGLAPGDAGPSVGDGAVGAGGVAARRDPAKAATPGSAPAVGDAEGAAGDDAVTTEGRGPRRRFGLRRRQHRDDDDPALPRWQFGQPAGAADAELTTPPAVAPPMLALPLIAEVPPMPVAPPVATVPPVAETLGGASPDADVRKVTNVSVESPDPPVDLPGTATLLAEQGEQPDEPLHLFVAPRAGFHIVDDASPRGAREQDEAPIEMPVFSTDNPTPAQEETAPADAEFLAWQAPPSDASPEAVAAPAEAHSPVDGAPEQEPLAAEMPQPVPNASEIPEPDPPSPAGPDFADENEDLHRGWRVRDHRQASRNRGAPGPQPAAEPEDDPFGTNPKLADTRRRIEERLRRKRCDEAAALLQALAQDVGGRAVADLAMNAGDRCRALGKSNAALNCYLAASRSDPVYEQPLSRLADVCIDAQDTELAVTYLERIARLYRFRNDDREALRVYRRIATIAPYREDVLSLLMNAQRTGRLD